MFINLSVNAVWNGSKISCKRTVYTPSNEVGVSAMQVNLLSDEVTEKFYYVGRLVRIG